MPRELRISVGQHSDKGRKEINQDFHGVLIPKEPLLSMKGIAIVLADGISSSNVSQIASEFGGQKLPDRLLLHVGILVGEDVGAARAGSDQLVAERTDPAQPVSLRQGQGLRLHAQRDGHQVDDRASVPRRRLSHLSARRPRSRAADRGSSRHRFVRAELSQPRAWASIRSSRSTTGRSSWRRAMSSCWRPTASTNMSGARFIASTIRDNGDDLDRGRTHHCRAGLPARQPGQPDRPDRPHRRTAGRRGQRGVRAGVRAAAASAPGSAG